MADAKKILIGEDERPLAKALELKLTRAGFLVQVCFNGEDVVAAVKAGGYDLILLDLIMPKMDGFAVLEALQAMGNKTPVIVTSNLSQAEDIARTKSLGAVDYLVKSNTPLVQIVEEIKKHLV